MLFKITIVTATASLGALAHGHSHQKSKATPTVTPTAQQYNYPVIPEATPANLPDSVLKANDPVSTPAPASDDAIADALAVLKEHGFTLSKQDICNAPTTDTPQVVGGITITPTTSTTVTADTTTNTQTGGGGGGGVSYTADTNEPAPTPASKADGNCLFSLAANAPDLEQSSAPNAQSGVQFKYDGHLIDSKDRTCGITDKNQIACAKADAVPGAFNIVGFSVSDDKLLTFNGQSQMYICSDEASSSKPEPTPGPSMTAATGLDSNATSVPTTQPVTPVDNADGTLNLYTQDVPGLKCLSVTLSVVVDQTQCPSGSPTVGSPNPKESTSLAGLLPVSTGGGMPRSLSITLAATLALAASFSLL